MPHIGFEFLVRQLTSIGGPVVVVLLVISIVATATSILKIVEFRRLGVGDHRAAEKALASWTGGDRKAGFATVEADRAALSQVAAETMRSIGWRPEQVEWAREHGLNTARVLLAQMSRQMRLLETIVQAAPMLGLLGTVLGMIAAFGELAASGGVSDPAQLAGGIWTALSTTAAGLAIAIPFYFISNWLEDRIERERAAMEATISQVLVRSPLPYGTRSDPLARPAAVPLDERARDRRDGS